jgi:Emfourin
MRITVSMPSTGVFYSPGLARPVVIDVDQLPTETAEKLKALAERAGIFDQSNALEFPPAKGLRDAQEFAITVEEGDRRSTIRWTGPTDALRNEWLREFVDLVRKHARPARQPPASKSD